MTNKEAIEVLQSMKSDFPLPKAAQTRRAQNDALDAAIEALKAEPCEDAVSRQAVLDVINNPLNVRLDVIIKNLPSVTPVKLLAKISFDDKKLKEIATKAAEEIKEDLIITDFSGNTRTITATKAAPNVPCAPPVYAVSADDVIENMESELELCNRALDELNIVGTERKIHSRVAEMLREQIDFVKGLPQVEPEPRKGKWIGKYPVTSVCSECNYLIHDNKVKVFAYCPNCGAKMEEQDAKI